VDVVHTRNAEAFFYGVLGAKLAGVRRVVHSEHGRVLPDTPRRMAAQRFLLRFVDAAFAVSAQLRRDLVTHLGISNGRFEVIYNGVDVARGVHADRASARRSLGATGDELVVGAVGRLVPVKNYGLLVRAFARVAASTRRPVRLVLLGEGPERAALQAAAAASGIAARTALLGHRDDVADLLAGLDVFVLPSVSEGLSNTLLEAMAAGVPVVASDVGGNREIVEDGRTGLLFASGEEAGLVERLTALVEDPAIRERLASAGRERVVSEFSIGAMIRNYEALYERVAR
jgi:glycosyltransferase involved in cell wall biosynthesis